MSRVFTGTEQNFINEATDPNLILWSIWAAKETVYKIIKKIDPNFVLSHRKIEVDASPVEAQSENSPNNEADSVVAVEGSTYAIRWIWTDNYVDCIGISKNREKTLNDIYRHVARVDGELFCPLSPDALTQRELASCFSEESIQARLLAKHLLRERRITNVEIIREQLECGFGPPSLISSNNSAKKIDISLSHDDKWISVALLI